MDDQQLWLHGLRSLNSLLKNMDSAAARLQLTELLEDYMCGKESLAAIVTAVDSKAMCSKCAGQCCLNGKYRMNLFDVLSHCIAGMTVMPDFFQKPVCPYGTLDGCSMAPGFRPADCVFFICDSLDSCLSETSRIDMNMLENRVRECLYKASQLLKLPVTAPILLWAEKSNIPKSD